jgi:uncharacterized membrane protein YkvA (DUF1232 family)
MTQKYKPSGDVDQASGFVTNLIRQGRLAWRLFRDRRVPGWLKLIPFAGIAYLLSPIDLIPDVFLPGLGELDDLTVILLSVKAFIDLAPTDVVNEHLQALMGRVRGSQSQSESYIEVPYRVVDDDDKHPKE